eukprot:gene8463-7461_t
MATQAEYYGKKVPRKIVGGTIVAAPECPICGEPSASGLKRVCIQVNQHGDRRYTKTVCKHTACTDCLAGWIEAQISCGNTTILGDPKSSTYHKYVALVTAAYRTKLLDDLNERPWLKELPDTVPCPKCRVVLCKYAGCDDFRCTCGHTFNFSTAKWPSNTELMREIEQEERERTKIENEQQAKALEHAIVSGDVAAVEALVEVHSHLMAPGVGNVLSPADLACH